MGFMLPMPTKRTNPRATVGGERRKDVRRGAKRRVLGLSATDPVMPSVAGRSRSGVTPSEPVHSDSSLSAVTFRMVLAHWTCGRAALMCRAPFWSTVDP